MRCKPILLTFWGVLACHQLHQLIRRALNHRPPREDGRAHDDRPLAAQRLADENRQQRTRPAPDVVDGDDKALQRGVAVAGSGIDRGELLGEG